MGLKSLITDAIETAFDVLGESTEDGLQVSVAYYQVTGQTSYNSTTRKKTATEVLTTFESIKYDARDREIDGIKIKVGDARLIFPTSRLSFAPSHDDRVEIAGVKWNIVNAYQDPALASWTLFIRGV